MAGFSVHRRGVYPPRPGVLMALWALIAACAPNGHNLLRAAEPPSPPPAAPVGEPSGELTLSAAVQAAIVRNPDLAASAYDVKAADARITQAGLRPNPQIDVDVNGGSFLRGGEPEQSTLLLSQVLELGGKRGSRIAAATMGREVVEITRQAQQLDVLAEVTRRFIALVCAQERLKLARSATELSQRTLDTMAKRVEAARSPEAERSRSRIALIRAHIEEQQAAGELRTARLALAALWGSEAPQFREAQAELFVLDTVEPFEGLVAVLERSPDFLVFVSEARLREAELRLAHAEAKPNLTLGVGAQRSTVTHDTALIAGFSIPLPIFDRNQGGIREAEVRRAQTDVQRQAALLRARATLYGLYQELQATRSRVETLRTEALPQAEQALEQTQYGFERGRFSYLELASAQQDLLELRGAAITAAANYHLVLSEIERLTGEPIGSDTPAATESSRELR